jgi:hypothetical protein
MAATLSGESGVICLMNEKNASISKYKKWIIVYGKGKKVFHRHIYRLLNGFSTIPI